MKNNDIKTSAIFYMGGKKKLIKKGLINLFPKDINTFVDLFGGSGIVSMNVVANHHILNDIDYNLFRIYNMFKDYSAEYIISNVNRNILKYGLLRVGTKQNSELSDFYKKRYIDMRNNANKTNDILDIYSCIFYAFSQQMRFNKNGKFNMPFGNGAFTEDNECFIRTTVEQFENFSIYNKDFRNISIDKLTEKDFIYMDCPYLNTTATYNESGGWTMKDDLDLFELCENLDKNNIKFGISNVFENKKITNTHLIDWCEKNNWKVYNFDTHTYSACGKGNSHAKEVYICNYEK